MLRGISAPFFPESMARHVSEVITRPHALVGDRVGFPQAGGRVGLFGRRDRMFQTMSRISHTPFFLNRAAASGAVLLTSTMRLVVPLRGGSPIRP